MVVPLLGLLAAKGLSEVRIIYDYVATLLLFYVSPIAGLYCHTRLPAACLVCEQNLLTIPHPIVPTDLLSHHLIAFPVSSKIFLAAICYKGTDLNIRFPLYTSTTPAFKLHEWVVWAAKIRVLCFRRILSVSVCGL